MSAPTEDLIDRLGAAALDARAAVREVHEAIRDLRTATAEAREVERSLRAAAKSATEASIEEIVAPLVRDVATQVGEQQQKAIEKVFATFDELSAPLLAAFRDMGVAIKVGQLKLRPEHGVDPAKVALPENFKRAERS